MSDLSSSGSLHGRALAQEMRRQQALRKQGEKQGKAAVRTDAPRKAAAIAAPKAKPMAPAVARPGVSVAAQPQPVVARSRGREAALARRAMRCAGAQCWADPKERQRQAVARPASLVSANEAPAPEAKPAPALVPGVEETFLDAVCELVESDSQPLDGRDSSVRALCKARRRSLAHRGRVALNVMRGLSSAAARLRYLETGNAHEFARLHRQEVAKHGRGGAQPARPTGQQRSRKFRAPEKVGIATTLAGTSVSGTLIERTSSVTGIETGSCRNITGTEYVGAEHYSRFCDTRPNANPAKVGVGSTARRTLISGTQVARVAGVTGDEAGNCRSVTGTEYLGLENFQSFCKTEAPVRSDKVVVGVTERRQLPISGSDEARVSRATGAEVGAGLRITGSQYADSGSARMTINGAPKKVSETHTFRGETITGTAAGGGSKVTGLGAGECRPVTGTEYLSQETFQALCRTQPEVTRPAKVGETETLKGQRITGNLVDRSEKVTGNEPGSCQRVTGAGYTSPRLCGGGVDKVQTMTNLTGRVVTGTGMDRLPKTTGDGRGGCLPVTGIEYYGREHYAQCASTPEAEAAKVAVTRTPRGQWVSGPALGPVEKVTGTGAGSRLAVSGTPYQGEEQNRMPPQSVRPGKEATGGCGACGCKARMQEMEAKIQELQNRQGPVETPPRLASSTRFVNPVPVAAPVSSEPLPADFSIVPPSRQGRSGITGNVPDPNRRITGPVDMAGGLITGTPEFRSRDVVAPLRAPSAPALTAPSAEKPAQAPAAGAWQVTGDDWSRSQRVTGTEGHWAQGRNPTQRGAARTCVMSAAINRDQALAVAVPEGKVTGSSGNFQKGSLVTYSGGARG